MDFLVRVLCESLQLSQVYQIYKNSYLSFLLLDSNCVKMLELGVVPHILDLLEQHVSEGDVSVQHAGLSALRNLAIPGSSVLFFSI